ncbi:MAG TPA: hypothetical protein VFH34_08395 [Anaerolineales bacterium]|nr:hypothetical protein [Anaerolineales bacterium]
MKKSGELVDRSAADRQFFGLARKFLNFQNLPARTSGLVAARLISSAATIFWQRKVRQFLGGLTRGCGNGTDVRPAPSPRRNFYGQKVT